MGLIHSSSEDSPRPLSSKGEIDRSRQRTDHWASRNLRHHCLLGVKHNLMHQASSLSITALVRSPALYRLYNNYLQANRPIPYTIQCGLSEQIYLFFFTLTLKYFLALYRAEHYHGCINSSSDRKANCSKTPCTFFSSYAKPKP
jgi:hypothetical protein